MMDELLDLFDWTRRLEAGIAFLLLLPVLVAIAGVVAEWRERRKSQDAREILDARSSRSARRALDRTPRSSDASVNVPRP